MKKRYGDTNTNLTLTDKAERTYNGWSPLDIWETCTEDENGEDSYSYSVNICGDRRDGLTADEVNRLLEELADEVAEEDVEEEEEG